MKYRSRFFIIVVIICTAFSVHGTLATQLNLDDTRIALHGYDPVSYHLDSPKKGSVDFTFSHNGAIYLFANKENIEKFKHSPEPYLPAFGGWCAWAMLDGEKVDVDPETYKIVAGTTYLFYNFFFTNTLTKWNKLAREKTEEALARQAQAQWLTLQTQ